MKDDAKVAGLITEIALLVFRANGSLVAWGDGFTKKWGLTSARWQMLGAISMAGGKATAPQAAAIMGVSRQAAQKQLNLLLDAGLVGQSANPANRRSPFYSMSAKGGSLYREIVQEWEALAGDLASGLNSRDMVAARKILEQLTARIVRQDGKRDR